MTNSQKIIWIAIFGITFALVEAAVVNYLRALYYPEGFSLPLKLVSTHHLLVETSREVATMVMLATVGILAGQNRWQRFAYFMVAFGVWDIFYYVWLKVFLDWPSSIFEWDVLFLFPVPWIGPVIAPVLVSTLMTMAGILIIRTESRGDSFRPGKWAWITASSASLIIFSSFTKDFDGSFKSEGPHHYEYILLVLGVLLYVESILLSFFRNDVRSIPR